MTFQLAEALARIAQLEHELDAAYRDAAWGILTRAGVERRLRDAGAGFDVVYGDIDRMHDCNTRYGHDGVDARIRAAFQARLNDCRLAGRWLAGDEVVFLVPAGDGAGFAARLCAAFAAHGLSITVAVSRAVAGDYRAAIDTAQAQVETAKRQNRRGRVVEVL